MPTNPYVLEEKLTVIDTVNRLFIETDNKAWSNVKKLFTDDVYFDMTSLAGGSAGTLKAKKICAMWEDALKDIEQVHHQSGNFRFESFSTDKVSLFCYGTAYHYKNEQLKTFVGSYNFELIKDGKDWKIASMKYNVKFVHGLLEE